MLMEDVAEALVRPGRGILAIDESTPTIGKRLAKANIVSTEDTRRDYRELFLNAEGIENSLSGAILYKETLGQRIANGTKFVDLLQQTGIYAGIKVDEGLTPLHDSDGESHTKGLENLAVNCRNFASKGAKFSKWRAAIRIGNGLPSDRAISVNAEELASYAAISQAAGLVPLVEPEILIDGDYTIDTSAETATKVLTAVISQLRKEEVNLKACLLKIQMIMPGADAPKATPAEIAEKTLSVLTRCIPLEIPGIVFLSGGLSEEEATVNLNEINRLALETRRKNWGLSFSFGRALQASVLDIWSKDVASSELKAKAKKMAAALAAANASATLGKYNAPHPSLTSGALMESNRGWL